VARQFEEPRRDNRYWKYRSHELDAECSVYVDGNIELATDVTETCRRYLAAHDLAFYRHPERDCIYDEAAMVINMRKDRQDVVDRHVAKLAAAGYPRHNGLVTGTYIWRRDTEAVAAFNRAAWEMIATGSKRDQLSINYVLWRKGLPYHEICKPWGPRSSEFVYHFR